MTSKLYVGNLPPDTKEKELRDLFGSFGDVEEVAVFNKEDGPGFAFVVSSVLMLTQLATCTCVYVNFFYCFFSTLTSNQRLKLL